MTVDVVAHKETHFTDQESGCVLDDTWDAARLGVPVDGAELEVEFSADEQQTISSLECPPQVVPPTGEVGGAIGTPGAPCRRPMRVSSGRVESPGSLVVGVALVAASAGLLLLVPRSAPRRARPTSRPLIGRWPIGHRHGRA